MGKKFRRKKNKSKGRRPQKDDIFQAAISVEVDEQADELLIGHEVSYPDGSPLFELRDGKMVWHLDPDALIEFEAILEKNGIDDEQGQYSFKDLNKLFWRKLIKALRDVNDFGERYSQDMLGQ